MAFQPKTWKDRVSEQPQRRLITPVGGGTSTTVDVTRQEGIVIQEGDAFSAANMNDLENRIKTTFDTDEASIRTINTRSSTNANNIASLQNNVNTINNSITNLNNNKAPTNHAVNAETYGLGTQSQFGHVKLSDSYTASNNKADYGLGASGKALADAYSNLRIHDNIIENQLFAPQAHAPFYFDWQNGKYGFNTDVNRGADTFHPFNSGSYTILVQGGGSTSYTFNYPYSCAVVFTGGIWIDSATCTGNGCNVTGGWAYYGDVEEHSGGRLWMVTDINVGSSISWSLAVGDDVTVIGIGQ